MNLKEFEFDPSVVDLIPYDMAQKYNMIAVSKINRLLTVAISDAKNIFMLDAVKFLTGCSIKPVLAQANEIQEAINLTTGDILTERGLVHVHLGKGSRDRVVPLPRITLLTLREYYKTHRNPKWMFPALGHDNGKHANTAKKPISGGSVQDALQRTVKRLRMKKHVHPHVFRHAYATHLLEANVPIRHVQKILGHKTLKSTMVYLHVTTQAQNDSNQRVSQIMHGVLS